MHWLIEVADPFIIYQIMSEVLDENYFQEHAGFHKKTLSLLIQPIIKEYRKTIEQSLVPLPKN